MLDDKAKKNIILVAGMHRSGTSAVTRILNILGCTLPKTLSGSAPDNARGFWESQVIKDLNDQILVSAGSAWDEWEELNLSWYASSVADEFREHAQTILESELGDGRLFVLKDPRICRLMPFWIDAVRSFGAEPLIVSPIRNPLDVAASLEARDGIDPSIGLLMWLRHHLSAEAATRSLKRVYLRYERLLFEPHTVVDELGDALCVVWPKRSTDTDMLIDEFLSPALRHHRNEDSTFLANPRLSHWLRSSFKILDRWACGKVQKRDTSALERIKAAFDDAAPTFGRPVAVGLKAMRKLGVARETLVEREGRIEGLSAELGVARETLVEREGRIEGLSAELGVARETLVEREGRIEGLSAELGVARETLVEREGRIEGLSAELGVARETLVEREGRIEGLSAELGVARETLVEREGRIEGLSAELGVARETLVEREGRIEGLSAELGVARETLVEREGRIEGLSAELGVARETLGAIRELLAEREDQITRLERELLEIRASTSWQFTTPIRYVGGHVKGIIRFMKLISLILRTPKAIIDILQKSYIVLRQGGIDSIRQKLHIILSAKLSAPNVMTLEDDRKKEFNPPDVKSSPDIFVLSIIDWDFRFQRPQHLAIQLAQSGRRVFYIEMMLEPDGMRIAKIQNNLYRVRLSSKTIGYIQPYTGKVSDKQKLAWIEAFNVFGDSVEATSFKQIIIQHPFWWQLVRSISPEFQLIYDCMDDVSGFSNTDRFILGMEREMTTNCDTLIVSSENLFDKYKNKTTPIVIRNAADIEHFSLNNKSSVFEQTLPPLEIRCYTGSSSEEIKVGYVGAVAEWFDGELVRRVALNESGFQFHLCGAVSDRRVSDLLQDVDNIFMYGEIGYVDVPSFLAQMDVLIIPFKIVPIIESCDPVKFYEYSAMGKPTVSTHLPELLTKASDLVFFASTADEFAGQIRKAYEVGRKQTFCDLLKSYAMENSWEQRCDDLTQVLQDFSLVSVIILSYGDPELAKASIHSLFDHGLTYPKLEVLVVDNGSSSTSLDVIKSLASGYPNVEIIENGSNLGFAKGNNVGLSRAAGEYVVLLNNDTYVAPGAIHAMVRHLASNPEIGAVGPLTNNIGNEAKMSLEYRDMEQMKKISRRITLGYRGRFFPVDTLGYFAVMFRRSDVERFGLLPLDYGLGMFEDDDHCRTIQSKGYVTAVAEDAFVHHHLSASFATWDSARKEALFERNRTIFEEKWGPWKAHQYRKVRPDRML